MKPKGRHPDKALTAVHVRSARRPGRYADGNGLYLIVDQSGAKRWLLRTVAQGRRRDMGLGGAQLISLAEARERATHYRKIARDGGDPIAEKRKSSSIAPTFAEAARSVHVEHTKSWRNAKHAAQWIKTIETYVNPIFGDKRVDQIETPDVLRALSPIWLTRPETARRVRQRIATVLDWAKAAGHRNGDNPVDGVASGLPKQPDRKRHFAAMAYGDVPGFVHRLRGDSSDDIAKLALEFLILTAARTGEVLGARWPEFDIKNAVWTVPATRMKADRGHRVPLSKRAIEILRGEHLRLDFSVAAPLQKASLATVALAPKMNPAASKSNLLLASLAREDYALLHPHMTQVHLVQHAVLQEPEQPIEYIHFPLEGMVSVVAVMTTGESIEIAAIGREGAIGTKVGLNPQLAFAKALVQLPGTALRIAIEKFQAAARQSLAITHLATCAMDVMTANVQQAAACNAMHPVEVRLVRWLLHARDCFDRDELPLTQEYLAQMLGVRRTSVTLAAVTLQNAGLIKYRRGKLEITDRAMLEEMCCDCYGTMRRNVELIVQTARLASDPAKR